MTRAESESPTRPRPLTRLGGLATLLILLSIVSFFRAAQPSGATVTADTFFVVIEIDGHPWICRSLAADDGRFMIRALDGNKPILFSGRPIGVTSDRRSDEEPDEEAGERLVVLFRDAVSRVDVDRDEATTSNWSRVPLPDGIVGAAIGRTETGIRVAGWSADDPAVLRVYELPSNADRFGTIGPTRAFDERPDHLAFIEGAQALVAVVSEGANRRVERIPLVGDELPLTLATLDETPLALAFGRRHMIWLGSTGRLGVASYSGTERASDADLPPVEDDAAVALALTDERLYALSAGAVVAWPLDDERRPEANERRLVDHDSIAFWSYLSATFAWLGLMTVVTVRRDRKRPPRSTRMAVVPAPLPRRLLAWFLDAMLVFLVTTLVVSIEWQSIEEMTADEAAVNRLVMGWQIGLFVYFYLCEELFGRSFGKRAIGLRIVDIDGKPPSALRTLVRNALRFLDRQGGAVLAILTPRRQRVGDWLGRTMVVMLLEIPEAESDD